MEVVVLNVVRDCEINLLPQLKRIMSWKLPASWLLQEMPPKKLSVIYNAVLLLCDYCMGKISHAIHPTVRIVP
jgi:hypothetical protein